MVNLERTIRRRKVQNHKSCLNSGPGWLMETRKVVTRWAAPRLAPRRRRACAANPIQIGRRRRRDMAEWNVRESYVTIRPLCIHEVDSSRLDLPQKRNKVTPLCPRCWRLCFAACRPLFCRQISAEGFMAQVWRPVLWRPYGRTPASQNSSRPPYQTCAGGGGGARPTLARGNCPTIASKAVFSYPPNR
ncbi:hypothetical protein J6590_036012 [Homalodisca vitripennis]|nr:hypothetical protein J6590_036012 [Homalodisca vitripennis]